MNDKYFSVVLTSAAEWENEEAIPILIWRRVLSDFIFTHCNRIGFEPWHLEPEGFYQQDFFSALNLSDKLSLNHVTDRIDTYALSDEIKQRVLELGISQLPSSSTYFLSDRKIFAIALSFDCYIFFPALSSQQVRELEPLDDHPEFAFNVEKKLPERLTELSHIEN